MKKRLLIYIILLIGLSTFAQMVPERMIKAFGQGDAKVIAEYFHDNLEMQIITDVHVTSKNQAARILQNFFKEYPPRSFKVTYEDTKYSLGTLSTSKGSFRINIYFMEGRKEKIIYYLSIEKA